MTQANQSAHEFKGLSDWIEVFRAGTHTDSKGRSCTFTEADLDQMVSNLALGAAPAVLGHPKHNDPAFAWVKPDGAKREGNSLFVKFEDINPAFEAGVNSGAYRNRSVSVFQDKDAGWRMRHVGWLGAAAPAIDGLTPLDSLDEEKLFLQSWRKQLEGDAADQDAKRARLAADQGALASDRNQLDSDKAELAFAKTKLETDQAALADARAKLDADIKVFEEAKAAAAKAAAKKA